MIVTTMIAVITLMHISKTEGDEHSIAGAEEDSQFRGAN